MNPRRLLPRLLAAAVLAAASGRGQEAIERFDTAYNSLTVERRGDIVELRARFRGAETLESAVDLADPLRLVVAYTRSLYGALFFHPKPQRVLMVGLGGAGFHRLFAAAYPAGAAAHGRARSDGVRALPHPPAVRRRRRRPSRSWTAGCSSNATANSGTG
jgi:hypothetical protein